MNTILFLVLSKQHQAASHSPDSRPQRLLLESITTELLSFKYMFCICRFLSVKEIKPFDWKAAVLLKWRIKLGVAAQVILSLSDVYIQIPYHAHQKMLHLRHAEVCCGKLKGTFFAVAMLRTWHVYHDEEECHIFRLAFIKK